MSFSDILALLEILVTILFGYYITHWVSVRDTRTRSVKDIYLSQLSGIKKQVDSFFKDLFDGKLKGRTIADWYGHQQNSLTCFDEGLRMALPIRKEKIEDVVNEIHETITGSKYYNDHFREKKYILTKDEQVVMTELKNRVDRSFNEYVVQINNSRQYYFWETLKQNYRFDVEYFKSSEKKCPRFNALKIRLLKALPYIVAVIVLALVIRGTYASYRSSFLEEQRRQNVLESGINKMLDKADSVNESLHSITLGFYGEFQRDSSLLDIISKDLEKEKQLLRELHNALQH